MDSASGTRFGSAAQDYHRLRPTPPPAAVDWLTAATPNTTPITTAVELGAGTGLFTAPLAERVATVFAVEPDSQMRRRLAAHCPGVTVLDGTAEHIPLGDGSVDAVFCHSAWHWVDPELALPEIARVLVPGGLLAIAWTMPDRRVGWRAKLDEITGKQSAPGRGPGRFDVPPDSGFDQPAEFTKSWTWRMTTEDLVASLATYDQVLALSEMDRNAMLDNARTYLNGNPATSRGTIEVPFRTVCFRTHHR
jgi:SAM-dependent methyltransferase